MSYRPLFTRLQRLRKDVAAAPQATSPESEPTKSKKSSNTKSK